MADLISELVPILRRYTSKHRLDVLDRELQHLQGQLAELKTDNTAEESDNDTLIVDVGIRDLQDDVQTFILESLGYDTINQLVEKYPKLDGPLWTLRI